MKRMSGPQLIRSMSATIAAFGRPNVAEKLGVPNEDINALYIGPRSMSISRKDFEARMDRLQEALFKNGVVVK